MRSYEFIIKSRKEDIDFINKVMEAYEGLGVVRTLNAKEGDLSIISTDDFKEDVRIMVEDLDRNHVAAKIVKEGPWEGNL